MVVLQETKLQEKDVEEWRNALPNYTSFWTCSIEKKGYAGCAAFVKQATDGIASSGSHSVTPKNRGSISSFFNKIITDNTIPEAANTSSLHTLRSVTYGIGPANEMFGLSEKVVDTHGDTDLAGRL